MASPIRVLLIEDNPADARLINEFLQEAAINQFELIHVSRLKGGLNAISNLNIDAILLDLGLPDSFGLDTFTSVTSLAHQIPIVILSGNQDESIALDAVKLGAQNYVTKGFRDGFLLPRIIHYAIARKQTEITLRDLSTHVETAREEERHRIARDIHDELGGVLTAVKMDMTLLINKLEQVSPQHAPCDRSSLQLLDSAVNS